MSARPKLLVLSVALLVNQAACALGAYQQRQAAVEKYNADAHAAGLAAAANARSDRYAVGDETWLCPTADAARAGGRCEGGHRVLRNRDVTVIGLEPVDGVWRTERSNDQGAQPMFVAAAAVNELPDLAEQDALVADLDRRYPASKRIPLRTVTFANLVDEPAAFRGRVLVLRQPSGDMTNKDFAHGKLVFTLPIPVTTGSRWAALAQFEMKSPKLVADFKAGTRSYRCGPTYCDEFVIVATLTGRTVDRVDELGQVHRLPVFEISELGDRYGTLKHR